MTKFILIAFFALLCYCDIMAVIILAKIIQGDDLLKIHESAENYLETILILSKKKPSVRSIDIVNELEFTKPSVSVAMKNLRENGCIKMDKEGYITLTDKGRNIAESMYERHTLLSGWLISLGVEEDVAVEDACKIEHYISDKSFEAIKKYILKYSAKMS